MMPEAFFILVDGSTMTRDEITDSLDGMPGWDSYDISDALLPLGSDAAALIPGNLIAGRPCRAFHRPDV